MRRIARQTHKRKTRGFTLLEFVVTLAILAIVAAIIGRPLADFLTARTQIDESATRQADIDYALARMATAIRSASTTVSCTSQNTLEIASDETYQHNSAMLTLEVITAETSPTTQILLENVSNFSCEPNWQGLRLYKLTIDAAVGESPGAQTREFSVRAFQRDGA